MNSSTGDKKSKKKGDQRLQDANFDALDGHLEAEEETVSDYNTAGDGQAAEPSERPTASGSSDGDGSEYREKYLRALAELENYKKRALKDRAELLKYQGERVLYDLLEVMDNLELALKHAEANPEKLKEGVLMIHKQFAEVLKRWEVKSESALGRDFDPAKFSAISRVAVHDAQPGTVIGELKKAYFYKDKLLRPGEVVVADAGQTESDSEEVNAGDSSPEASQEGD